MKPTDLRSARQRKGLTQTELSERSGVDQSVISRLENGGNNPEHVTVVKLERALGLRRGTLVFSAEEQVAS